MFNNKRLKKIESEIERIKREDLIMDNIFEKKPYERPHIKETIHCMFDRIKQLERELGMVYVPATMKESYYEKNTGDIIHFPILSKIGKKK